MLDAKTLGYIQIAGAVLGALLLYFELGLWTAYLLCLLFLLMGLHHLTE